MPPLFQHPPIMRMRWRHLLFAHWAIDADKLRPLIPPALEIDTFQDRAWVGLVPFTMEDVSPTLLPPAPRSTQSLWSALWGGAIKFHECNVRTYVYPRGRGDDPASHGVWFFSLDATSRLAVWGARAFWGLPYQHARIHLHRDGGATGDVIDYGVDRVATSGQPRSSLRIRWRALDWLQQSQPGDLAHFLTERYCLYAMRNGTLHRGTIQHRPWSLRAAELLALDDTLVRAAGITLDRPREPLVHHADELDVRAWRLAPVLSGMSA
jgi:uncharacterized protein YqjF (DUF2071 family)